MFSMKRRGALGGLAVAALMVGALTACSTGGSAAPPAGGDDDEVIPIRVAYSVGPSTLPIIVGELEGFFEDHGLDFTGTQISPGPAAIQGLGRQYDVLQTSTQSVLESADQGLDILFVTGMGNSTKELPAFPVFVADDSIDSWGDLAGTKYGVPSITAFATTTTLFLAEQDGAAPGSIETPIVPWDTQADQLKAGQVDAVWTVNPFSFVLDAQGYKTIGDPTLEATGADELVASVTAATGPYASENPEALKRFKAALMDAAQWVVDNPDDAKRVIIDELGLPEDLIMNSPQQLFKIDLKPADIEPMFVVYDELGMLQDLPALDSMFAKF